MRPQQTRTLGGPSLALTTAEGVLHVVLDGSRGVSPALWSRRRYLSVYGSLPNFSSRTPTLACYVWYLVAK